MSKTRDALRHDIFQPREWGQPSRPYRLGRPWYGLDTERDSQTADFVCGYAVGEDTLEFETIRDLPPATYWVWNLPYDIEGMIRDLGAANGWAMKRDGAPFTIDGAKCVYLHGKRFDWRDDQGRRVFLEASSFFGRAALKSVAAQVIGDTKDPIDASQMSLQRYWNDVAYRRAVREYCKKDARLVYDIITTLDAGCADAGKTLGVDISLGSTPGGTARKFLSSVGQMPKVLWATHLPFLRSYCGGRFEIVKRGFIPDVYQYDIVSAYPWALTQCPFLTDSATHQFTRRLSPNALYGTYEVSFATDEYLGLAPRWRQTTRVYSAAEKKVWLTRPEIEWLHMHNYDYTIHQGVEVFDENATNTWAEVVKGLFRLKQTSKGLPAGYGAKIVLNSLYGVLIQLVPRSGKWVPLTEAENPVDFAGDLALEMGPKAFTGGKYYAPLYAGHLTALTRLKLLDAARSLDSAYIGGHTDSVLTTKPLKLEMGKELGMWDLEKKAKELIVTKTGMYAMDDKVKTRGIERAAPREALWAERQTRRVRIGIKTAKAWSDVSRIETREVANNLEIETKRRWDAPFSRRVIEARQHIDSRPLRWVGE